MHTRSSVPLAGIETAPVRKKWSSSRSLLFSINVSLSLWAVVALLLITVLG